MNIITKSIADLKPADYNPRVITEKELDNLKKSIHKFGYLELIVYNKRTDRIISGHQRLKALKELDVKEVEVIEVDLDEKDEKALNIAMNKISGDWDMPKLEVLLNDLKLEGMLDLTGFSELELKDLDKLVKKLENDNLEAEEDDFNQDDVWEVKKVYNADLHPTMKPIELCARAVKNSSLENDIVLDLFLGSGSTLISCEQLNRICYGMELDEHYCSVIIERYIKLKGSEQVFKLNEDGSKTHIGDIIE